MKFLLAHFASLLCLFRVPRSAFRVGLVGFFIFNFAFLIQAQTVITGNLVVTNATGTLPGNTITIGGTVWTFTNSTVSARNIPTTNTAPKQATNIFNRLSPALTNRYIVSRSTPTNIAVQTYVGGALNMSISAGWGTLAFTTNLAGNAGFGASNLVADNVIIGGTNLYDVVALMVAGGAGVENKVDKNNGTATGLTASGTFNGTGTALTIDGDTVASSTNSAIDLSVGFERLKRLADKVDTNAGPNFFTAFGDSMAQDNPAQCGAGFGVWLSLTNSYGYAGYALRSVPHAGGYAGNATSVGGVAATINQFGGANWWSLWHSIRSTAAVQFGNDNVANGDYGDTWWFFWQTQTNGSDMRIQVSTNGGAWGTLADISGGTVAVGLGKTNFSLPLNYYRFQITNLTSGTNIFYTPALWDSTSRGWVGMFLDRGGAQLSDMNLVPSVIQYGLLTNIPPDLVTYQGDEVSQGGYAGTEFELTNNIMPWLTNRNPTILMFGNAYRNDPPAGTNFIVETELLHRIANQYGAAMFDSAWLFQNWQRSTNLDYVVGGGDIIHWKQNGALHVGDYVMRRAGLKPPSRLPNSVVSSGTIASRNVIATNITGRSVSITALDGSTNASAVFVGDGTVQGRVVVGHPGGNYAGLYNAIKALYDFTTYSVLIGPTEVILNMPTATVGEGYVDIRKNGNILGRFYATGGFYWGASHADPGANNLRVQGTISAASVQSANASFGTVTFTNTPTMPAVPITNHIAFGGAYSDWSGATLQQVFGFNIMGSPVANGVWNTTSVRLEPGYKTNIITLNYATTNSLTSPANITLHCGLVNDGFRLTPLTLGANPIGLSSSSQTNCVSVSFTNINAGGFTNDSMTVSIFPSSASGKAFLLNGRSICQP